jgi:lysophospholipase L1-like esterase
MPFLLSIALGAAFPAPGAFAATPARVEQPFVFTDESATLRLPGAEGPLPAGIILVTPDGLSPARACSLDFRGGVATLSPLGEGIHIVRLGDDAGAELRFLAMEPPAPPVPGLVEQRLPRTGRKLAAGEPFMLLAMGDSVTETGEFHELLALLLQRAFGNPHVSAVKRGKAGRSIDATLRHFDVDTEELHPDLGLLQYGLNDQGARMPLPDFLATQEAIVETMAQRFGADTVTIASTPQLGGYWPERPDTAFRTRSWGVAQARVARERGRVHVDGFDALWPAHAEGLHQAEQALAPLYPRAYFDRFSSLLETAGRGDGTHPNALGHLLLAKAVYAALCLPEPASDALEIVAESAWTPSGLETALTFRNAPDGPFAGDISVFAPEDAAFDVPGGNPFELSLAPGGTATMRLRWRGTEAPDGGLFESPLRRSLRDNEPVVIVGVRRNGAFRTRAVAAPVAKSFAFRAERREVPPGTASVRLSSLDSTVEPPDVVLPADPEDVFRLRVSCVTGKGGPRGAADVVGYRPATAIPAETTPDADLSEWAGQRFIPLGLPCQARQIRGPEDRRLQPEQLFPRLAFASGADALHVAMRATGAQTNDWMTLFFDPRDPAAFCTPGPYFWASVFLRENGEVEVSRGETSPSGPGTTGRWRAAPDGSVEAEWDVPWDWMGLDGFPASGRLGFSAIYRQAAPPHTRLTWVESYFEWTPLRYGELRLFPDAAAESAPLPLLLRVEP